MKSYINKKDGFVVTSVLLLLALGLSAILGGGSYVANKTLNKKADPGFNFINKAETNNKVKNNSLEDLKREELSTNEKESLISMREEEKLARDVYRVLYEKWGLNIFKNISFSENRHSLAVKTLLDKYNIKDPVINDETGEFTSNEIRGLFESLIDQGSSSIEEALIVGATIEDLDIYDLKEWKSKVDNKDINILYSSLERGSRNHMRAFTSQLQSRNIKYSAKYLQQDIIDNIVASKHERGSQARIDRNMKDKKGNMKKSLNIKGR